ncbi:Dehydrogenase/reductase SDR family member 13 [Phytophthora cinnamomi]|uniref:Dehydrogenase/reductase SDR family member 13 n=1 Tax=Phytophthora cinnamomi TaxID=4785 RepID=UPI00355A55D0|nr:Dehydrogenase/reductase SDR family member 13 [Phytophthora cinnamomi]
MQQDRLEGWMVRQIENADLAKETVIQLPAPKAPTAAPLSARIARPSAATPRRLKGGVATSRRSVTVAAGQEMCSLLPVQSPRPDREAALSSPRHEPDESVEKLWRAQFRDRQQPCVEGNRIDRTKVLHNMKEKQQHGEDKDSPLFLWGLPREHILDFIRQSVLPSSWANPASRPSGEWEAVRNEEDEIERVRRILSNALALAPPKPSKNPSSPRAPSPPRSPSKRAESASSPCRNGSTIGATYISSPPSSPRASRVTPRSEERIHKFIAELRTDPSLWAAFQRDVEQIHHQHRLKNYTRDKIRENKERASTPRSLEAHELRNKRRREWSVLSDSASRLFN